MGEVGFHLDASFLVALPTAERASASAEDFVRIQDDRLIVCDFGAAEFASTISRRVRMREIPVEDARVILSKL